MKWNESWLKLNALNTHDITCTDFISQAFATFWFLRFWSIFKKLVVRVRVQVTWTNVEDKVFICFNFYLYFFFLYIQYIGESMWECKYSSLLFIVHGLSPSLISYTRYLQVQVTSSWTVNDNGAPHRVTRAFPSEGARYHSHTRHWVCLYHNLEGPLFQSGRERQAHGLNNDFNSFWCSDGGIVGGFSRTHIGDSSSENTYCWLFAAFQAELHGGIVESIIALSRQQWGTVYGLWAH